MMLRKEDGLIKPSVLHPLGEYLAIHSAIVTTLEMM
jgi:hypothetical protein